MSVSQQSLANEYDFNYRDFSSVEGLILRGHSHQAGNVLRVTRADFNQGGGAWYGTRMNVAEGFSTVFTFRISELGGYENVGGDGFSFNVHNAGFDTIIGEVGTSGQFSVQFDTYQNAGDPSDNFVRVNYLGQNVAECDLNDPSVRINLSDGEVHRAEISLQGSKLLVLVDGIMVASASVDLAKLSPAIVGFGGRSGQACENHDIHSWQFTSGGPRRA